MGCVSFPFLSFCLMDWEEESKWAGSFGFVFGLPFRVQYVPPVATVLQMQTVVAAVFSKLRSVGVHTEHTQVQRYCIGYTYIQLSSL